MSGEMSCCEQKRTNYIVGIGASAGGLEAIQKFLSGLPANTGCSFIIIQHLSPDYKSLLCEILSRHTVMPVIQAEEGMVVEPNSIYIIQPRKNMRIQNGKLRLSAHREHELNFPIDFFFRSLAEEAGERAIAIILSGTGSDGSQGIIEVKDMGGLILAQDDTAKFDGMPKSAMRTGVVDTQMPPEMMASEIAHIATSFTLDNNGFANIDDADIDEELFKKLYVILKKACNINFSHYKRGTLIRRMACRMMLTRKKDLTEYVDYLYTNAYEAKILSKEILIGVTSFFRDPEYLQILKEKAIQDILLTGSSNDSIRVWVAGCSTGEEAYSIAILFLEAMETLKVIRPLKIFATDLDSESIEIAGKGAYRDSIIDAVSSTRLSKYFTLSNGMYTIKHDVRKCIIFSRHNVFQDPPFGKLDLISCRNMMIYFQPILQNELFNTFHIALKEKGYLFLGKSESVGSYSAAFPSVNATAKLFTHNREIKYPNARKVSFLQMSYMDDDVHESYSSPNELYSPSIHSNVEVDQEIATNSILELFLPGCIIVDDKNKIVHTYGDCSNYMHIPVGVFTNELYGLLVESLKIPVSTILKEARDLQKRVQYTDICFNGETKTETICLTVQPMPTKMMADSDMFAILFLPNVNSYIEKEAVPYEIDRVAARRITDLEQTLTQTQQKLNKSIADQECVNEELQAANEELLTANEELQSSNEELQSVNEELYTVNSEYQMKLTELSELNDDIANFLSSRLIGIIFVDRNLNIRRYTDYVSSEFSVMPHDIGRPIKSITYHFPMVDIPDICLNVLETLLQDDREVVSNSGKIYAMRTEPYFSSENKIDGCVITFNDGSSDVQEVIRPQTLNPLIERYRKEEKRPHNHAVWNLMIDQLNQIVGNADKLMKQGGENDQIVKSVEQLKSLLNSLMEGKKA